MNVRELKDTDNLLCDLCWGMLKREESATIVFKCNICDNEKHQHYHKYCLQIEKEKHELDRVKESYKCKCQSNEIHKCKCESKEIKINWKFPLILIMIFCVLLLQMTYMAGSGIFVYIFYTIESLVFINIISNYISV